MRYAARVDPNQGPIVEALRKAGASVQSLAAVGSGCPDLLVGFRNRNFLMEVKRPIERGKTFKSEDGAKLNPVQQSWTVAWRGEVAVVRTIEDALAVVGLLTR